MTDATRNMQGQYVIRLYSTNNSITKKVEEYFAGHGLDLVVEDDTRVWPRRDLFRADVVLSTRNINKDDEWFAARIGAYVAVVPEALEYVLQKAKIGKVSAMVSYDVQRKGQL